VRRVLVGDGGKKEGLRIDKNSSRASVGRLERGDSRGDGRSVSGISGTTLVLRSSRTVSSATLVRSICSAGAETRRTGRVRLRKLCDWALVRRTGRGATS